MIKIQTKIGNLINVTEGHIVHGCNAQGVMGSGVALAVRRKFPGAYEDYIHQHKTNGLELGRAYLYVENDNLYIWNAITQGDYGYGVRQVSYDAVQTCFEEINAMVGQCTISDQIHIPMIGAARGGGNWEIIREIIEQTMTHPVTLWLPDSTVNTI